MSKKLSVLFLGFVMLLSVLAPKASFADTSIYDFVVTIAGKEYVVTPDEDSMEFNVDDFISEVGLQETDKVEKFTVFTPDGVESVTFEFLTLNPFFPDATIQVADGKAEYVVSEVLGDLDKQSDGVSIQLLRQLMYPVNYQAWVTATADYGNGDFDVLDVLFTSNDSLEVPASNAVELDGITLITNNGPVALEKVASNQFYLDLAGKDGDVQVTAVEFYSDNASTLSTFSNDSALYRDETDVKFVDGVATMSVDKLTLAELADIIGEGSDYLTTFQEMRYMVASLGQDTFNAYVADANGSQSPFQVVVGIEGWTYENGKWYYIDFEGEHVTGWLEDGGDWYYLDPEANGAMKTGWLKWNGEWYYLNLSSGVMETGFERIKGKTYYFHEDGVMAMGLTKVGSYRYYFDEDKSNEGALVTGWEKVNGNWYFFNKSTGAAETGWEKIGNKWFYFNADGVMQSGWEFIKGKWYFFNYNGEMQTGWFKQGTKWYYLDAVNGDMKTGWLYNGYKWYYLDKTDGFMKTGWVKDGTKWYYLDNGGVMKSGWIKDGGKWYFLNKGGDMKTGWLKYNYKWYYLDNGGVMKTGWVKVGTKWYYMYNSGVMAANTTIGGYRLGSDGAWIQ
ncbi:hypothetical protein [Mesobacillus sp. S13]|uniref:hypothetical protein n=1 Tax=Mesobacillus sp. S13 TaxID=2880221 RepID=UPI001CF4A9E2|nr:hypothetical protein [Mesobacillus sp. S13]